MSGGEVKKGTIAVIHDGAETGALSGCLVEGDEEQLARAKRARGRALAISLLVQATALAAVILIPLIWATERIALGITPPQPIYVLGGGAPSAPSVSHGAPTRRRPSFNYLPSSIPTRIPTPESETAASDAAPSDLPAGGDPGGANIPGALPRDFGRSTSAPLRPLPTAAPTPRRVVLTQIEPAKIIHRVEPVYPILATQTRRSGRVELHAIIATDGTIQLLQAVGGDPLFFRSALDAVRQWRYRPTILNGQAVEVETTITVIYRLQ
jgi:protein TonB